MVQVTGDDPTRDRYDPASARTGRAPMPRSAAQPPEQALQGNLFGAPEPAADPQPPRSRSDQDAAATADLSDASLSADARQRPRQRREQEAEATPASDHSHEAGDDTPDDGSDTPAWAHHSQVDPLQLTPMLRHYVELKAAHPERLLLYRLGDFFEIGRAHV